MATFVAEEGTLKGLELSLEEGERWVIGRNPDEADLILEDPKVSRKHLLCTLSVEGLLIENLSDTNPVIVNDREILGPTLLHDGDRMMIGGTLFRFYTSREKKIVKEEREEPSAIGERPAETIFRAEEFEISEKGPTIILPSGRFIFKVVAGPQSGAEIVLDEGKSYLIGTDSVTCDIVFHDLSVSREHARLTISEEGEIIIEDLGSRNGVIIDKERISGRALLPPNRMVALGTSLFLVIDKKAPMETLLAPSYEEMLPKEEEEEEEEVEEEAKALRAAEEEKVVAPVEEKLPPPPPPPPRPPAMAMGPLILTLLGLGLIVLIGVGILSLFQVQKVEVKPAEFNEKIESAVKTFPGVKFSFIDREGKLLLYGHVVNGVEKNELLYKIQNLPFVKSIQDEVVDDEAVTQEMNILISKNPAFQGVTIYAPDPGCFIVTGYLKSGASLLKLSDFLNLNFNFLSLLKYKVIVEDQVADEVKTRLMQNGFPNVTTSFSGGLLTLTGYIPSTEMEKYTQLLTDLQKTNGVRIVRNYVVAVTPEAAVVDLSERYPGRYEVSGTSKQRVEQIQGYPQQIYPTQQYMEKGYPKEIFPGEVQPGVAGGVGPSGGAGAPPGAPPTTTVPGQAPTPSAPTPTTPSTTAVPFTPAPTLPPTFAPILLPGVGGAPGAPPAPGAPAVTRYEVTGITKHCDVNMHVVINGRILMRGDLLDGMTITSIQPNAVYLEKDGLKYKIEYNK